MAAMISSLVGFLFAFSLFTLLTVFLLALSKLLWSLISFVFLRVLCGRGFFGFQILAITRFWQYWQSPVISSLFLRVLCGRGFLWFSNFGNYPILAILAISCG